MIHCSALELKIVCFSCVFCSTDSENELQLVQKLARDAGAYDAVISSHWSKGGAGAMDLATALEKACNQPSNFQFLYDVKVGIPSCFQN